MLHEEIQKQIEEDKVILTIGTSNHVLEIIFAQIFGALGMRGEVLERNIVNKSGKQATNQK